MLGAAILLLLGLAYGWLIQQLPNLAVEQIGRLTNTDLRAKSIRLNLKGFVEIRDLLVQSRSDTPSDWNTLLRAGTVQAKFSRLSLLLLNPKLKHIVIRDFVFDVRVDLHTGTWNVGGMSLNIPAGQGGHMPSIRLEGGTLRYCECDQGRENVVAAIPLDALFDLNEVTDQGYHFQIKTAGIYNGIGQSTLNGFWKPGTLTIAGGLSSRDAPSMERVWSVNAMAAQLEYSRAGDYTFALSMRDLRTRYSHTRSGLATRPSPRKDAPDLITGIQGFFDRFQPAGVVDVQVDAAGRLDQLSQSRFTGHVQCLDVALCDQTQPYPIEHIQGTIDFENTRVTGRQLKAMHHEVPLEIDFAVDDLATPSQYEFRCVCEAMPLDADLYNLLSEGQQALWQRINPQGTVAMDYRVQRSPEGRERTLTVQLKDAGILYTGFPYALDHLTGTMTFSGAKVEFPHLVSQVRDRRITLRGWFFSQSPSDYAIDIRVENIAMDATLAKALPPQARRAYDDLGLTGKTDAVVQIRPDPNDQEQTLVKTDLTLHDAFLHVPDKPLPLTRANGRVSVTSNSVVIHELKGLYFDDPLSIQGLIRLNRQARPDDYELLLASDGLSIPAIKAALPENTVAVINHFQPEGKVAFKAHLKKTPGAPSVLCNVAVQCAGLTFTPKLFPYPLYTLNGQLVIDQEQVRLDNLLTVPVSQVSSRDPNAETGLRINGELTVADGQFQAGQFQAMGRGLIFEEALGRALPEQLAACYKTLAPSGDLAIDQTQVRVQSGTDRIFHVDYWTTGHVQDCRFDVMDATASVTGSFEATGHYDTQQGLREGAIALHAERVTVKGKTATHLHALLRYLADKKAWEANDLVGDFYKGRIAGMVSLGLEAADHAETQVQLAVTDADLREFLLDSEQDAAKHKNPTTGLINGQLSLVVPFSPSESRIGRCLFTIAHMQVGKVSALAKLLTALQLTEPKDYVFENMLVDAYIQDNRLLTEKYDLAGESLALKGQGTIDLAMDKLRLTLIARGRRLASAEPSVFQALTEGLGGAVMRVEVSGSVENPTFVSKTLPVIEDSFKLLGTPSQ